MILNPIRNLFLAGAMGCCASLHAAPVIYEPFAQPTIGSLNGQTGGTGLSGNWTTATAAVNVQAASLALGALTNAGKEVFVTGASGNGGSANIATSTALANAGLLTNGRTLWFGFVIKAVADSNNHGGFALGTAPVIGGASGITMAGGNGLAVRISNLSVYAVGFNNGSITSTGGIGTVTGGAESLVVGKITWGSTDSDTETLTLYRPSLSTLALPAPIGSVTVPALTQSALNKLSFCNRATVGANQIYDEIRFGATYLDVIGASATDSHWDLNGTTAGSGSTTPTGTWDAATNPNWNATPDGTTTTPAVWTPGHRAVFSAGTDATGTYGITVDGTQSIGGLILEDGTATLSGGTALDLVTAGGAIEVKDPTKTATISTPITQTNPGGNLYKEGVGTLVLSGANTYTCPTILNAGKLVLSGDNTAATGAMTLNAGTVQFDAVNSINGAARNVTVNSGTSVMFGTSFGAANIPTAMLNRIVATSAGSIAADNYAGTDFNFNTAGLTAAYLGAVGDVTYTGTLTPNGNYRLGGGGGTLTIANNNALTGSGKILTVAGPGTVVLSASNNHTGSNAIPAGARVIANASGALGTGTIGASNDYRGTLMIGVSPFTSGQLCMDNGATIMSTDTTPRTITSAIRFLSTSPQAFGDTVRNGKLTFTSATVSPWSSSAPVLAAISDVEFQCTWTSALAGLTKTGPGTMTFTGAQTWQGTTTINQGPLVLNAGSGGSLNGTTGTALTFGGSGTFVYDATAASATKSQGMGALTTTAGDAKIQINRTTAQTTTLTFSSLAARSAGATANFVCNDTASPAGTLGTDYAINLTGTAAGPISVGHFVDGSDYAYMNAAGTYVRHPVYDTDGGFVSGATLTASSHNLLTANLGTQATTAVSSIKVNGAATRTIQMGASGVLSCDGVLVTGGSSLELTAGTGTSGIKTVSSAGELVVRADAASDSVTLGAVLANGASRLTKTGAGALTLKSGANTYTGATVVNEGTLLINNSPNTACTGATTVREGATLGGSGTWPAGVTVQANGTLQPHSSSGVATLTLGSTVTGTVVGTGYNTGTIGSTTPATSTLKVRVPTSSTADKLSMTNASAVIDLTKFNLVIDTTGLSGNATGLTILQTTYASGVSGGFNRVTANNGYLVNVTYNANSVTVDLTSTGGTPTISLGGGPLAAVNTTYGTPSASPTSFTVAGSNLTGAPGNLTVTPPAGYEVSLSSGSGYSTSLSIPYASASLSATFVYLRLAATTGVGNYSGNISVSGGGATSQTIATVSSAVSQRILTFTGAKPYDGNASATAAQLVFGNNLDGVNLTMSGGVTLVGSAAGSQAITDFSGLSLGGSAAGNYSLTGASGTVIIQTAYEAWLAITGATASDANLLTFAYGAAAPGGASGSANYIPGSPGVVTPGQPTTTLIAGDPVDFRAVFSRRSDYATAGLGYTLQFSSDLNFGDGFRQDVPVTVPNGTSIKLLGTDTVNGVSVDIMSVSYPWLIPVGADFKKPTFYRLKVNATNSSGQTPP